MSLVIVSSSHRNNSNSMRTARYLEEQALNQSLFTNILVMNLAEIKLPLWDDLMWAKKSNALKEQWAPIAVELQKAKSFIFISPEWNGMAAPALYNFLLYCTTKELAHKPALITTVSTGIGGSYPISEIRMSGYKNNRICYLPEHIILRSANDFFDKKKQSESRVVAMQERILKTLELLKTYTEAFNQIRNSHTFDFTKFPNGM